VLMVVYGHAGYFGWVPLVAGLATTGVILFFFLSGFLMAHHYLPAPAREDGARAGLLHWAAFLLRRYVRVYPPYLFAPLAGYLLLMPYMPPDFETQKTFETMSVGEELLKVATFSGNKGIYWTIQLELFFYACYPLLIAAFILSGRRAIVPLMVFCVLGFLNHFPGGIGGISWTVPLPGLWTGYSSIFVAGVFAAIMAPRLSDTLLREPRRRDMVVWASVAALAVAVWMISLSEPTHASMWRMEWLFAPLLFVLFTSLAGSQGRIAALLSSRPMVMLGKASYSIYLVHLVAIYLVIHRVGAVLGGFATYVLVLACLATAYYLLVERPFVRLSKKIKVGARGPAACAAAA
jgi:peptidoglycan/LPS O-acetylase OafA/YrhL